jgi:NAD(P)-dependent dehydrogenase (short-subunit alcohol dehydrogenase family)
VADLADELQMVAALAEAGPIDILVNNAALLHSGPPSGTPPDFDATLAVNLRAPFILSRERRPP